MARKWTELEGAPEADEEDEGGGEGGESEGADGGSEDEDGARADRCARRLAPTPSQYRKILKMLCIPICIFILGKNAKNGSANSSQQRPRPAGWLRSVDADGGAESG